MLFGKRREGGGEYGVLIRGKRICEKGKVVCWLIDGADRKKKQTTEKVGNFTYSLLLWCCRRKCCCCWLLSWNWTWRVQISGSLSVPKTVSLLVRPLLILGTMCDLDGGDDERSACWSTRRRHLLMS